jgi:two-component system chemotaxis response regulator CheB
MGTSGDRPRQNDVSDAREPRRPDVVVVGASAGGVEALTELVARLPQELPAAVFVVLHMSPSAYSVLPEILARAGALPASAAVHGERFEPGHIYVCPPDHHMRLSDGHIGLSRGPRENGHRPAVDPLFRSAARALDGRAIGVILSGTLDDGTAGLRFLKARGGTALVQDPSDASYPGMPVSAINSVAVDRVLPAGELADAICDILDNPVPAQAADSPKPEFGDPVSEPSGSDLVEQRPGENEALEGEGTAITCPDCGGVLFEHDDGEFVRYACRVGHAYSPDSLIDGQSHSLETALWTALRSLEERADLFRRMSRRASGRAAANFGRRARDADAQAALIRRTATEMGHNAPSTHPAVPEARPA